MATLHPLPAQDSYAGYHPFRADMPPGTEVLPEPKG